MKFARYLCQLLALSCVICGCASTPEEPDHYVESIRTLYMSADKQQFWVRGAEYDYQFAMPPELLQVMERADLAQLDVSFKDVEANKDAISGLIVMTIPKQASVEARQKVEGLDFFWTPRGSFQTFIRLEGKRYLSRHSAENSGARTLSREYKVLVRNNSHGDYSLLLTPLSIAGNGVGIAMGVAIIPLAIPVGVVGYGVLGVACTLDDNHGCR
ncbi:hypothetical protein ACFOSS_03280 [Pseudaeromonas sharmana]|uniref:Lipoprotein n=1 Tax=Pseudaeromonas sharmana TaxID=328412 RepID=A0ABV8CJX2_9GAMM